MSPAGEAGLGLSASPDVRVSGSQPAASRTWKEWGRGHDAEAPGLQGTVRPVEQRGDGAGTPGACGGGALHAQQRPLGAAEERAGAGRRGGPAGLGRPVHRQVPGPRRGRGWAGRGRGLGGQPGRSTCNEGVEKACGSLVPACPLQKVWSEGQ